MPLAAGAAVPMVAGAAAMRALLEPFSGRLRAGWGDGSAYSPSAELDPGTLEILVIYYEHRRAEHIARPKF